MSPVVARKPKRVSLLPFYTLLLHHQDGHLTRLDAALLEQEDSISISISISTSVMAGALGPSSSHSPDSRKRKRTRDLDGVAEKQQQQQKQRQRQRRQQPAVAAMMMMKMLSDEAMELSQLILESGENQAITLAQELHRYLLGKGNKGARRQRLQRLQHTWTRIGHG